MLGTMSLRVQISMSEAFMIPYRPNTHFFRFCIIQSKFVYLLYEAFAEYSNRIHGVLNGCFSPDRREPHL